MLLIRMDLERHDRVVDSRGPMLAEPGENEIPLDPPLEVERGDVLVVYNDGEAPRMIRIEATTAVERLMFCLGAPDE